MVSAAGAGAAAAAAVSGAAASGVRATAAAAAPADDGPDMLDQLQKLGELRAAGVLTEAEFAAQKAKILAG